MSIYVERVIGVDRDRVWALTQTPESHERWDLRFTSIRYLPKADSDASQSFEYETRLGFGLSIRGTGTTAGEHRAEDGASTSALVFASSNPWSLIRKGSGYWRYVPEAGGGTRFITGYDYAVRWGKIGWLMDRAVFRPLMAWATAWSFDRLAIWLERGIAPDASIRITMAYSLARLAVAGVWLYEGLFPKLLGPHPQEIMMTVRLGIPAVWAAIVVMILGSFGSHAWRDHSDEMEAAAGRCLSVLRRWFRRSWAAARAGPELLSAPFNVVTLNGMTAALSLIVLLLQRDAVSASACHWRTYQKNRKNGGFSMSGGVA